MGCGLDKLLPNYVKQLGLHAYLAMEPLSVPVVRDFSCLVGAVAENIPLKDDTIGAAIFATSLDHIEKAKDAIAEVDRVLKPDGSMYFWIGLHDPWLLAEAKSFGPIVNRGSIVKRIARIAAAPAEYGYLLYRMWRRGRRLAKGISLDHAHCKYYTKANIEADMKSYGLSITRSLLVPNSSSIFIEARAKGVAATSPRLTGIAPQRA